MLADLRIRNVAVIEDLEIAFERIEELARMLGGVTITKEARRHAAELRRLGQRGVRG